LDAVEKRRERPVRNADARGRLPGSRPDSVRATHTQAACLGLLGPIVLLGLGLTGIVVEASSPAAFATSPLPPRAATLPVGMWTNVTPAWSPGAAIWPAMAYSPDVDRVVLLTDGANGGQTWMYDLASTNWTQAPNGTASPGVRALASMVYEPALRKFVLFGGYQIPVPGAYLGTNDTWLFDPTLETWTNVTPLVSPPTRYGQAMAYVPDTGRIVLFGGNHMLCAYCYQGGGFVYSLNDLWAYDAAADTCMPVAGQPNTWGRWVMLLSAVEGLYLLGEDARAADLTQSQRARFADLFRASAEGIRPATGRYGRDEPGQGHDRSTERLPVLRIIPETTGKGLRWGIVKVGGPLPSAG